MEFKSDVFSFGGFLDWDVGVHLMCALPRLFVKSISRTGLIILIKNSTCGIAYVLLGELSCI
jgi:hypothetical protein